MDSSDVAWLFAFSFLLLCINMFYYFVESYLAKQPPGYFSINVFNYIIMTSVNFWLSLQHVLLGFFLV
jgi:hypothetical protein